MIDYKLNERCEGNRGVFGEVLMQSVLAKAFRGKLTERLAEETI